MADGAGQHEEVPDGVVVGQALPDVEEHPHGVAEPAGQEPGQAGRREGLHQGPEGDHHEPAHAQVEQHLHDGQGAAAAGHQGGGGDARDGQAPDQAKVVFPKNLPDGLCLPPETELAGKKSGKGRSKIGNKHLKWAFSEAAVLFLRSNPEGMKFKKRLEKKHGKGKAMSILAHRLGRAVYFMLKRERAFDMQTFLAN